VLEAHREASALTPNTTDTPASTLQKAATEEQEVLYTHRGRSADSEDALVIKKVSTNPSSDHPQKSGANAGPPPSPSGAQSAKKEARISFLGLFKYSSCGQKLLVYLGLFSSVVSGLTAPLISLILGEIVGIFNPRNS